MQWPRTPIEGEGAAVAEPQRAPMLGGRLQRGVTGSSAGELSPIARHPLQIP